MIKFFKALVFQAFFILSFMTNGITEEPAMNITSTAFEHNGVIPTQYTCLGEDVNPPLKITGIPAEAKSLALIVDDPDAPMGTWVHWVVYNIPPSTTFIKENTVPGVQGNNDFGKLNYGGPCPPSGTHRYFFKIYAVDYAPFKNKKTLDRSTLEFVMQGHILGKGELIGLYK